MTPRVLLLAPALLLAGCAMHVAVKATNPPGDLNLARARVEAVMNALPTYEADPISRYEQPEILNIRHDLASMQDETDVVLFIEEAELVRKDWGILVALDNTLQQESVI